MSKQRGTALLEIIVIGFAVMLLVLPVISMAARLSEANGIVHAAARDAAVWVTRHGSDPPSTSGVGVWVVQRSDVVEVVATRDVELIGVAGASVNWTVRSRVEIPISEYRSRP